MELREQTRQIKGRVKPLRLNAQTIPGQVLELVNWAQIFDKHTPTGAIDIQFALQLEYLQCDYYLLSPMKIPASEYPDFNDVLDSSLAINNKVYEFKRKFSPSTGHAVRLSLHTKWTGEDYGPPKADEYLYNLGQRGYLNLFSPYLLRDADVDFGDRNYTIGVSISEGELGEFDLIEINAGYSGTATYYKDYENRPLQAQWATYQVDNQVSFLPIRSNRVGLYLSNAGSTRLYFAFGEGLSSLTAKSSPFIEPGQSASFEFNRVSGVEGWEGYSLAQSINRFLLSMPVGLIRETGSGPVGFQEFYY